MKAKTTTCIFIALYLSFMTIQVSLIDHLYRSAIVFLIFVSLFYWLFKRYIDNLWTNLFNIIASKKKLSEKKLLSDNAQKSFLIQSIISGICALLILLIIGSFLLIAEISSKKDNELFRNTWTDTNAYSTDNPYFEAYSKYSNLAEYFLSNSLFVLFFLLSIYPIAYFIRLRFKERLPLREALFYPIVTTIIIIIILSIVVEIAIFFYYTIGILMGGEQ